MPNCLRPAEELCAKAHLDIYCYESAEAMAKEFIFSAISVSDDLLCAIKFIVNSRHMVWESAVLLCKLLDCKEVIIAQMGLIDLFY